MTIRWWRVPGKRDWQGQAGDRHFLLHVGHGELWYAFEKDRDGNLVASRGKPWDGPEAQTRAREWCEEQSGKPPRKGIVR